MSDVRRTTCPHCGAGLTPLGIPDALFAHAHDIPFPLTLSLTSPEQLGDAMYQLGVPIVVKGCFYEAQICHTLEQARTAWKNYKSAFVSDDWDRDLPGLLHVWDLTRDGWAKKGSSPGFPVQLD